MKGRDCADGRPQRDHITKGESSSPTVSLYALMGSCVMDAFDERKVITIDIPGAFLQGEWPQDKHPGYIMFEGITVEMICEIDPSYHKNVIWIVRRSSCTVDSSKLYMVHCLDRSYYKTNYPNN